jgi:hypothetical protein
LFRKIKEKYPERWVAIGEPGWQRVISQDKSKFQKGLLTFKYMLKGDKQLDADPEIRKLRNLIRCVYLLILLVIISFIVFAFVTNPSSL